MAMNGEMTPHQAGELAARELLAQYAGKPELVGAFAQEVDGLTVPETMRVIMEGQFPSLRRPASLPGSSDTPAA